MSARRLGDELLLEVGTYRRTLILPRILADLEVRAATVGDGGLNVIFEGGSDDDARGTSAD